MAHAVYSERIISGGIGKALNLSKNLSINRSPLDLEFQDGAVSRWSVESHTFVTAWGEFCPSLEDFVVLTGLLVFGESKAIKMYGSSDVTLDVEGEVKLLLLNEALFDSKHKNNSTYTTWVTYFTR